MTSDGVTAPPQPSQEIQSSDRPPPVNSVRQAEWNCPTSHALSQLNCNVQSEIQSKLGSANQTNRSGSRPVLKLEYFKPLKARDQEPFPHRKKIAIAEVDADSFSLIGWNEMIFRLGPLGRCWSCPVVEDIKLQMSPSQHFNYTT